MDNSIFPFVEVRLEWATHHRWQAGDTLARGTVGAAYALWLVLSGMLDVDVAGRRWRLNPGDAFLVPPHLQRELATIEGVEWLSVGISAQLFGRVDLLKNLDLPAQWNPESCGGEPLALWMRQIAAEWVEATPTGDRQVYWRSARVPPQHRQPRDAVSSFISAGLGQALFGACWRMLSRNASTKSSAKISTETPFWLTGTLEHIAREPGVSVHELAQGAGFSPAQFRRIFHTWVGASPQAYVTQCRLEEARRLLIVTDQTVDVVAQNVGFESASYFTRLFKQRFGAAPARFRQSARQRSA
ncbi:MAG: AraC family transcriptional regulator [Cytophagales bacterium]|nr:AraC family transcriptional regulator [Armatimonadota bacterium]